jgi:nucleoid-associated protein YgaU
MAVERDALVAERDALSADVAALGTDRDALTQERENLAAERDEIEAERAALAADLASVASERDALVAERDALAAERAQLAAEREDLAVRLTQAETEGEIVVQQLGETVGALESAQERSAGLTEQLSDLLAEQAGLEQTTQAQRDQLEAVRAELEAAQSVVARLTGARGIYTVQPADSLSSIATFFYRSGNRWPDILEANANLIDDANLIFSGMVLIIPQ